MFNYNNAGVAGADASSGARQDPVESRGALQGRRIVRGGDSAQSRGFQQSPSYPSDFVALQNRRLSKVNASPYIAIPDKQGLNLNGAVSVPSFPNGGSKRVNCSFLAHRFGSLPEAPRMNRFLMQVFSTVDGIANTFSWHLGEGDKDHYCSAVISAPPESKHLISGNQLGKYLESVAATMPVNEGQSSSVRLMLLTNSHALAAHIQHKHKEGVGYFSITLFDPNNTATYKRVETQSLHSLSQIKLEHMLVDPEKIKTYGGRLKSDIPMVAMRMKPGPDIDFERNQMQPSPDNLNVAAAYGSAHDVRSLIESAVNQPPASPSAMIQLIGYGYTQSDLTSSFFAGKNERGIPAMSLAVENGHPLSVELMAQAILASDLRDDNKVSLLSAQKMPAIFSAMQHAMSRGYDGVVRVYFEEVMNSNLNNVHKISLINGHSPDNISGLSNAISIGARDTVGVYSEMVLNSDLDNYSKFHLLVTSALPSQVRPGVVHDEARGAEKFEAVIVFTQAVLNSALPNANKMDLIRPHKFAFFNGLQIAFTAGNSATVQLFTRAIIDSSLEPADKFNLLSVHDNHMNHVSVYASVQAHSNGTVGCFTDLVSDSDLSQDQKSALIGRFMTSAFS